MNERQRAILEQWFGDQDDDLQRMKFSGLWWKKDPEFDRQLRDRFGADLQRAQRGELDGWCGSPKGRLALIILLDQFSRNIYRDTPAAFANDAKAYALCTEGLDKGEDQQLSRLERAFFYMPLMHQEDPQCQKRSVEIFKALLDGAPAQLQEELVGNYESAKRHAQIIERFGRYPHRNKILGRETTAEEAAFLSQPNSSF